ncbi:hypothetical protein TSTA_060170 [Talaromyces stipitatus ATCC 10500]|uniref:Uncharacterized protein n=1 Tax=Talaromyces stipitatus (strain ATCC 10500 / CBS 375.48 / QM 6759 / NRRL 1006) TaxID=441959 RepID=B8LU47_TALSN|nr:uncharacterized protein TSTA_060170 [Talaromyces stipitatus ATCC 10500]XP_002339907.1 uncharacterized protein TSTA_060170 [Talaromyces stipitatus ATCC 10500]EED22519.1 hypothetical protein TSTA_060170 [Talaromyces stipitatus ATCC 10500]EED22520.1 hypothetical protein TSTA_060170 [Talaromyces stipitatus ATCC 10500]
MSWLVSILEWCFGGDDDLTPLTNNEIEPVNARDPEKGVRIIDVDSNTIFTVSISGECKRITFGELQQKNIYLEALIRYFQERPPEAKRPSEDSKITEVNYKEGTLSSASFISKDNMANPPSWNWRAVMENPSGFNALHWYYYGGDLGDSPHAFLCTSESL